MISIDHEHISLANLPTPLEFLERLSNYIGTEIWVKRDDLTGFAGGGNKVRKLEYLMADAVRQGADTIVTVGALQSNHARQTAAAAAKLGMECTLVLAEAVAGRTDAYARGGNLALDRLTGARIERVSPECDVNEAVNDVVNSLKSKGKNVYLIPLGGSNLIGALGYAKAATELEEQLRLRSLSNVTIVTGTGSAGTQAGLIMGTEIPVLGISVSAKSEDLTAKIQLLLNEASLLDGFTNVGQRRVWVDDGFVGDGYGQPTQAMLESLNLLARLEGVFLDPVYSGKAMAGLLRNVQSGSLKGPVVFLHTGGLPAIFAYDDVI